ncbi:hypothetical protein L226DRAFT_612298 [Lentinus tigrinus ALCF2SS1-7]|uniref:F-box domain-containing protein n=1 Tax=Lentinus tigrinus ALCF2SS1-6 TaxID=1328759 RepID=A0A5C2SEJ6_9APHY|nr:hypothetical protein L227DRAFT_545873 [Lentinus tigrinus ALCF2SS1-6]RPD76052.1 hypothetical protein L226DRAFT_612298 [Lentinus tigrinus ALCF2SS1-7]
MARFDQLPSELLSSILCYLHFLDVLRCRQVCLRLKHAVDGDVRMQYKVELGAAGMEDELHSTLTASERLAVLRKRQHAWKELAWLSQEDITAPEGSVLWELYGGVFARDENRRTLHFAQLPSQLRRIEGRKWALEDIGMRITDFGIDPAQDLLVIVEEVQQGSQCRFHLKSMTTGKAHPMATSEILAHRPENSVFNTYSIQTSNEHLAVLLTRMTGDDAVRESELMVWNWKTGSMIMNVAGEDMNSFVFLTPNHILLLTFRHSVNGAIYAYAPEPCLAVLDLDPAHPNSEPILMTDIDYLCAFTYPDLGEESDVIEMVLRADPGPGWLPSPSLAVPFSVSSENRLLVVTLQVMHGLRNISTLLSFIPSSTLLSAINSLAPGERCRTFAWEEWGPDGSRLILASPRFSFDMPCYVYGTAFAMHRQTRDTLPFSLTIVHLDFNQLACRRALSDENEDDQALITEPTTLTGRARDIFEGKVTTSCPYFHREVVVTGKKDEGRLVFDELLLGEDSLILVSGEAVNAEPFYRVLTF